MKRKIKVGVIGAGRMGKIHSENIVRYVPQAKISAIADLYIDKIKEWAEDLGIEKITNNYKEIIDDDSIEVVFICSPTTTHSEIIIASSEVGKHIFCEKPLDQDLYKIKKAINAVEKSGIKFQIGFQRRFDHNIKKIKEFITNGSVGKIYMIKITTYDIGVPPIEYLKTSGGLFLDMTIHDFDVARFLTGEEAEEVYATGGVFIDDALKELNDIDTAATLLKFGKETIVLIDNCRKPPHGGDSRVEVLGSSGFVSTANDTETTASLATEKGVYSENPLPSFIERYKYAFIDEIIDFFGAIIKDKKTSVGTIDGLNSVIIGKAATESLKENKPIRIKYKF